MASVQVRKGEPLDAALRRLKRGVDREGKFSVLRRKRAFEKRSAERKRERAAAVKRHQKKLQRENSSLTTCQSKKRREWE